MLGTLSRDLLPARLLAALCALLVAAIAAPVLASAPSHLPGPSGLTTVIVRGEAGMLVPLEHSTVRAGGTVVRELRLIDGFSALIPTAKLAAIRALPGVIAVSPDSSVSLHSDYNPGTDPYSMASTTAAIGASAAWAAGITGAGVDVALVDSGVTPVQGLAGDGKVVNGPDLSVDSQNPSVRNLDGFGHGTFMAGLIGARDPGADPSHPGSSYLGVAPDARIVNVKVGSGSGAVDVSQVIAGIDWVVEHRHDNGLNIRVLNLSIGTNSSQAYQLDPLAFAAEVAWRSGIVVVVAAGNSGATNGHLDDPASDPYVIAVGASGSSGGGLLSSLLVATFSSLGNGTRNPDLVAPGSHLQGLRVPGSYIDQNFHSAAFGDRFFRGSGTSEAAAVTSGAVALLLQKRPGLQPGQVKAILVQTAASLPLVSARAQGAGVLRLGAGAGDSLSVPDGGQSFERSSGVGSLEGARGDKHVTVNGVALTGEEDIFGHGFSSADHAAKSAGGDGWSDGGWNGTTWSGTTWSGTTWSGTTWSGTTWSGTTWSGTTWSGTTWSGTTWSGTTWSGDIWSNYSWS